MQFLKQALTLVVVVAAQGSGQSVSNWTIQVSALGVGLSGGAYAGVRPGGGAEAQLRWAWDNGWSLGGGAQFSHHTMNTFQGTIDLVGPFVEPRYVPDIGAGRYLPYLAARLSLLRQQLRSGTVSGSASGGTANLGGGILVELNRRMNLDLGMTAGYTEFGAFTLRDRNQSVSGPTGSGTSVVVRVGIGVAL